MRAIGVMAWIFTVAASSGAPAQTTALQMDPRLTVPDEANNLSGAACAAGPARTCLLIGDEMLYARTFSLQGDTVKPTQTKVDILPGGSTESDAEGIAAWDGFYYLIGSHGMSKKEKLQESRFHVWRIPADRATGAPSGAVQKSTRLRELLAGEPTLKVWAEKPLRSPEKPTAHGVNIEGLAVNKDGLFLAFRGPVLNGHAQVLQVTTEAVFTGAALNPKRYEVATDPDTGLRDIVALSKGFLLLTGPEMDADGAARILYWGGPVAPRTLRILADVNNLKGDKPESLTLLSETTDTVEVLVMSDGIENGAPRRMRMELQPRSAARRD